MPAGPPPAIQQFTKIFSGIFLIRGLSAGESRLCVALNDECQLHLRMHATKKSLSVVSAILEDRMGEKRAFTLNWPILLFAEPTHFTFLSAVLLPVRAILGLAAPAGRLEAPECKRD